MNNTLILSFPIYKIDKKSAEAYLKKVSKILKAVGKKNSVPYIEENTIFVIGSIDTNSKFENPERRAFITEKLQKSYQSYLNRVLSKLKKRVKNDPELTASSKTFGKLAKLYPNANLAYMKLKSLVHSIPNELQPVFKTMVVTWNMTRSIETIIAPQKMVIENENTIEITQISDLLALEAFSKKHIAILQRKIEPVSTELTMLLSKLPEIREISFNSQRQKDCFTDSVSILTGKIFGSREALSLAKKLLNRYRALIGEIEAVTKGSKYKVVEILASDTKLLSELSTLVDEIELQINQNYGLLKEFADFFEKSTSKLELNQSSTGNFPTIILQLYRTLETFRFVVEPFEAVWSFTLIPKEAEIQREKMNVNDDLLNKYIIYANGIFKTFPLAYSTVYALRGIDLKIKPGEFVAIMGASGSGKTTLLNTLSRLDTLDKGILFVDKVDMSNVSRKQLNKMRKDTFAFIYQSYNLLPILLSNENVQFPADLGTQSKIMNKTERAK